MHSCLGNAPSCPGTLLKVMGHCRSPGPQPLQSPLNWGLRGRSRAGQESLERLGWGGDTGLLCPVKNLGLPGFKKYAQNMSECQDVYWRFYWENPYLS